MNSSLELWGKLGLWGKLFLDVGQGAQNDRNLMGIERALNVLLKVLSRSPLTFDVSKPPDGVHFPHLLKNILGLWGPIFQAPECAGENSAIRIGLVTVPFLAEDSTMRRCFLIGVTNDCGARSF
jgi:hypothetical protein